MTTSSTKSKKTIDIFEDIHPSCRGIFLLDNAPSHKKVADDSLNVDKMNVQPGGKQPAMRNTTWQGRVQQMVYPDGTLKGDPGGERGKYKEEEGR